MASDNDNFAVKREDGGLGRSLANDFMMHLRIPNKLPGRISIKIPECHRCIASDGQTWWDEKLVGFPNGYQPRNALITQRKPPFPQEVRAKLIDIYCPNSVKDMIHASEADRDCLIRPYLGRRRRLVKNSRVQAFSLRNFPLRIDQIESLKLDGARYARIMADTLAQLFWVAHIDANDIEFVLAPPSNSNEAKIIDSEVLGEHVVWILDFDCCRNMSLDRAGVVQAVNAFFKNDPFYPRPNCGALWTEFKDQFLTTSEQIFSMMDEDDPESQLPFLWVRLVEQRQLQDGNARERQED